MTKASKILQYVNYRMRVTVDDGRQFVGKFMAFDKHMNVVLGDAEEFRRLPVKGPKGGKTGEEKEEKRALGLVVVRGNCVVSMTVESKPPPEPKNKAGAAGAGPGRECPRRQKKNRNGRGSFSTLLCR
jgi:small nuclear ribonucleoprotein B and B'